MFYLILLLTFTLITREYLNSLLLDELKTENQVLTRLNERNIDNLNVLVRNLKYYNAAEILGENSLSGCHPLTRNQIEQISIILDEEMQDLLNELN